MRKRKSRRNRPYTDFHPEIIRWLENDIARAAGIHVPRPRTPTAVLRERMKADEERALKSRQEFAERTHENLMRGMDVLEAKIKRVLDGEDKIPAETAYLSLGIRRNDVMNALKRGEIIGDKSSGRWEIALPDLQVWWPKYCQQRIEARKQRKPRAPPPKREKAPPKPTTKPGKRKRGQSDIPPA